MPNWPGFRQIFRLERTLPDGAFEIRCLSFVPNSPSMNHCNRPSISDDGLVVAFETRAVLAFDDDLFRDGGPDTNNLFDIYVWDDVAVQGERIRRVSVRREGGLLIEGNGDSTAAAVSSGPDNPIAFTSRASNLVPMDTNGVSDVFLLGDAFGSSNPQRVSLDNDGNQSFNSNGFSTIHQFHTSTNPVGKVIDFDGRVLFVGTPCDWTDPLLCPAANNNCTNCNPLLVPQQVYLRDILQEPPRTFRVSRGVAAVVPGGPEVLVPGDAESSRPSLSRIGDTLAWVSLARNFNVIRFGSPDSDSFRDVFAISRFDLEDLAVEPTRISLPFNEDRTLVNGHSSTAMVISDTEVVFESLASTLVDENGNGLGDDDTNGRADIFVRDLSLALENLVIRRYSVTSTRKQVGGGDSQNPDGTSWNVAGRVVVYESQAVKLDLMDNNGIKDVFETFAPGGPFVRGDYDQSGDVDVIDRDSLLNFLFFSMGPEPNCWDSADANDDEDLDVSDVAAISNVISQGTPLPAPFPFCGNDPTAGSGDPLTCGNPSGQICPPP